MMPGFSSGFVTGIIVLVITVIAIIVINWIRNHASEMFVHEDDPTKEGLVEFIYDRANGTDTMNLSLWRTKLGLGRVKRLSTSVLCAETRDGDYLIKIHKKED